MEHTVGIEPTNNSFADCTLLQPGLCAFTINNFMIELTDLNFLNSSNFTITIIAIIMLIWKIKELIDAITFIFKQILKPFNGIVNFFNGIFRINQKISELEISFLDLKEYMKIIKKEITPNGGTSLADSIRRIESILIIKDQTQKALLMDIERGIFQCDLDGKNIWVNRTYARLLKCGTNELLGHGWKKFIAPDVLKKYNEVWEMSFSEDSEYIYELVFSDINGDEVPLKLTVSAIHDSNKNCVGYIGVLEKTEEHNHHQVVI